MNRKDEIEEYTSDVALKRAVDLFDGGGIYHQGQSWKGSLLEAHINSLIGAPLAILAQGLLLVHFGEFAITNPFGFALVTWPVPFYLSVTRIWFFRRIFEKYGVKLEPIEIYKYMKRLFRCRYD